MANLHIPRNFVDTTLTANHTIGDGQLSVVDGSPWSGTSPTSPGLCTVKRASDSTYVIFSVTGESANVLTISGAVDGTADIALNSGDEVQDCPVALYLTELQNRGTSASPFPAFYGQDTTIQSSADNITALTVKQHSSGQSYPLLQLQTSTGGAITSFDANGHLGIGTANPGVPLEVDGTIVSGVYNDTRVQITGTLSPPGGGTVSEYYSTETDPRWAVGRDLLAGGQAGIAFAYAGFSLATHGAAIGTAGDSTLGFYTSNGTSLSDRMWIDGNGKVTIAGAPGAGSYALGIGRTVGAPNSDYGIDINVYATAANASGGITGIRGVAFTEHASGTINTSVGMNAIAWNTSTGTVTSQFALTASNTNASTGTITNCYGIDIQDVNNTGGGTVTNQYGLFIGGLTSATNNYAIYSSGGQSYHAGPIGIGNAQAQPNTQLYVQQAYATTSGNPTAIVGNATNTPTSASTASTIGGQFSGQWAGSANSPSGSAAGIQARATSNLASPGVVDGLYGTQAIVTNQGTGTASLGMVFNGEVVNNGGGTISDARGVYLTSFLSNNSTIGNYFGFYCQAPSVPAGSTLTNLYGLYLEDLTQPNHTASSSTYAIYSAGGQSYHAGKLGLGANPSPAYLLNVQENANQYAAYIANGYAGPNAGGLAIAPGDDTAHALAIFEHTVNTIQHYMHGDGSAFHRGTVYVGELVNTAGNPLISYDSTVHYLWSGTNALKLVDNTGSNTLLTVLDSGGLDSGASIATPLAKKTSAYTIARKDSTILADATTTAFTVTLPDATTLSVGCQFVVKKIDSSANVVTIATTSSQTIDGSTSVSLSTQWQSVTVQTDGTNWFII